MPYIGPHTSTNVCLLRFKAEIRRRGSICEIADNPSMFFTSSARDLQSAFTADALLPELRSLSTIDVITAPETASLSFQAMVALVLKITSLAYSRLARASDNNDSSTLSARTPRTVAALVMRLTPELSRPAREVSRSLGATKRVRLE
jgi:hypothetical protein